MQQAELDAFLGRLDSEDLSYFPVRHHSPACARQLQALIESRKPSKILIEGPSDLTPLIPLLVDPSAQFPLAFYSTFDQDSNTRHAAYYPVCSYSPELVAMLAGHRVNAQVAFIDEPHAQRILKYGAGPVPCTARAVSLLGQAKLSHGQYIHALCEQLHCRDFDELWDHLVEAANHPADVQDFVKNIATYAWLSRQSYEREELELQGDLERERVMAKAIGHALAEKQDKDWILVVTGAFHVPGLIDLVQRQARGDASAFPAPDHPLAPKQVEQYLIPYSFERLDAMSGYSAGMPSPAYYDELWRHKDEPAGAMLDSAALTMLLQLVQETRSQGKAQLSSADLIAAMTQAKGLAGLRGRPGPSREDLLDAIKSCFVKGSLDSHGLVIATLARKLFQGHKVGKAPDQAKHPPILDDFSHQLQALGLESTRRIREEKKFDIYRDQKDRARSRFAHTMAFLSTGYAFKLAGPNWAKNHDMRRLFEVWRLGWTPKVESDLLDASAWGSSLRAAAGSKLRSCFHPKDPKYVLSAQDAVALMISACEMGLSDSLPFVIEQIEPRIDAEHNLGSLVQSMQWMTLARNSWEPLQVHHCAQLETLVVQCYERSCSLLPQLANLDCSRDFPIVDDLKSLAQHLDAPDGPRLDPELFFERLLALFVSPDVDPLVRGAATGILVPRARLSSTDMHTQLRSALDNADHDPRALDFLYGLLSCHPAAAHQESFFVEAMDEALRDWDQETLLRAVPHIRLALSALSPREVHRLAQCVARRYQINEGSLEPQLRMSTQAFERHLQVEQELAAILEQDGLQNWSQGN